MPSSSNAPQATDRVWLITGASSGFGREITAAALAAGDRVAATARRPEALDTDDPGVLALALDVTDPTQVRAAVARTITAFGRIDVLVNNAGYGLLGAVEETSDEQIRRIFATNVFGALDLTRAVLPHMRAQRSGHIIQISSLGGQMASAGFGIYSSTKFALEGFSEGLAADVAPLGIRVTIVEPGFFRTDFLGRSLERAEPIADYDAAVAAVRRTAAERDGRQAGDPRLAAGAIVGIVGSDDPPLRLALGADAVARIRTKLERQGAELDRWERTSLDTAVEPAP